MNLNPTFARPSGAHVLNQVPVEESAANGFPPSILSEGLLPGKTSTATEKETQTISALQIASATPGSATMSCAVNSASLTVQNNLLHQSSAYGHQQLAGRNTQGTYVAVGPAQHFLRNPVIAQANDHQQDPAAPVPLNSVLNTSATMQQDAYNRLSRYMQQQVGAARTGPRTHNSPSVIGSGSHESMYAADPMPPLPRNIRYVPGVPHTQHLRMGGRAPMDHHPYTQKRTLPYIDHQIGNAAKFQRVGQGVLNGSFAHSHNAAAHFSAASKTRNRVLENKVENAAAFFEGKERLEDAIDKSRSQARYQFNVDMLEEIFDGPEVTPEQVAGSKLRTDGQKADPLEESVRDGALRRLGEKMVSRTHEERMAQLEKMNAKFREIENGQTTKEKGSMKFFQKLERAADPIELETVREEYEQAHGVAFFVAPGVIVKKDLDCSKRPWQLGQNATIAQFP